ncbi:hypothetical protein JXA47_16625 [Candidatus Sumerlaeota bacterium]|nr:hypothetical protein [Candidatus Sumerlaeota bacterium]
MSTHRGIRPREIALLAAVILVALWIVANLWPVRVPPADTFPQALLAHMEALPDCHCGSGTMYAPSDSHRYRDYTPAHLMPVGFSERAFHLFERRHVRAYIDWWNVDEGLLPFAPELSDEMLRRALTHMRLSAQNVTLSQVHLALAVGSETDRRRPCGLLDRLAETAGTEEALTEALASAIPDHECYLVIGADLTTGEVRLAMPGIHGEEGLWGAFPIAVIDLHLTSYRFDTDHDPRAYVERLWPQVNHRVLSERAEMAQRLVRSDLLISPSSLAPMTPEETARSNQAALERAQLPLLETEEESIAVPETLGGALEDLMGERWPEALQCAIASAAGCTVLGSVTETGGVGVFHVEDPARHGVWGVVPIAVFTPDQADQLASVDWGEVADRWERWNAAL